MFIEDLIYKDIHKIDLRNNVETLHHYIDYFNETTSIIDYVKDKKIYVINEDKKIRVEIKDTGKGIKESDLDKVWDKYYKSEKYQLNLP